MEAGKDHESIREKEKKRREETETKKEKRRRQYRGSPAARENFLRARRTRAYSRHVRDTPVFRRLVLIAFALRHHSRRPRLL